MFVDYRQEMPDLCEFVVDLGLREFADTGVHAALRVHEVLVAVGAQEHHADWLDADAGR
jgi:hypothetical protein